MPWDSATCRARRIPVIHGVVSVEAPVRHFWRVRAHTERAAAMSAANLNTVDVRYGVPDVPLIVEDLLCQIEDRAADGDPAVIAQLWAQVDLLQGR